MSPIPSFLIVGTPRSGTTLVQRLACELPGVKVPLETQFFWLLAPRLTKNRTFPIGASELRQDLDWFIQRRGLDNGRLVADDIVNELDGSCHQLLELFEVIIRQLAGTASTYGEKTPQHLFWWKELSQRMQDLKFVVVVRDPRSVVASNLNVHWADRSHVLLAERWRFDQEQVSHALRSLGNGRCLLLRYEDVVSDSVRARDRLRLFLGLDEVQRSGVEPEFVQAAEIMRPDEWWKMNAVEAVSMDRIDAWRQSLTRKQATEITAICRDGMRRFGYDNDAPGVLSTARVTVGIGWRKNLRRLRFRASRHRHMRDVHKMAGYL
ncbi:MAG: sulfotransferase family protein [Actinomycetota bacterium]